MHRYSKFFSLLILGSVLLLNGCARSTFLSPSGPLAPATFSASDSNNRVGLDLYNFYQDDLGNVFFSPFSIITAMSMAGEGAAGQTALQIQQSLYLPGNAALRRQGFQELISLINSPSHSYELKTSNHVWVEQTFPLLPSYTDVLRDHYFAGVTNLDFIGDPTGSAGVINGAVSGDTNGKITEIVAPSAITPQVKLILTNAIYFKADWLWQFKAEDTFPQVFHRGPGNDVVADMMHRQVPSAIEDFHGAAQVLELPYQDREVSMFVFLPPEGGMDALEAVMTGPNLGSWFSSRVPPSAGTTLVALTFPKFEFETSYNMVQPLVQIGITDAFSSGLADFSGIDGTQSLHIMWVTHKAFVSVDEKGTEAAAATSIGAGTTSIVIPPPTVPFTVDRPFILLIRENTLGAILFMGRVNDPTL